LNRDALDPDHSPTHIFSGEANQLDLLVYIERCFNPEFPMALSRSKPPPYLPSLQPRIYPFLGLSRLENITQPDESSQTNQARRTILTSNGIAFQQGTCPIISIPIVSCWQSLP
jgi:hypothetical protein